MTKRYHYFSVFTSISIINKNKRSSSKEKVK
jgi:hypothetical protein